MVDTEKNNLSTTSPNIHQDNPWLKDNLFDDVEKETSNQDSLPDLPKTSNYNRCRQILRFIRPSDFSALQEFLADTTSDSPKTYSSGDDFLADNQDYISNVKTCLNDNEKESIRQYSELAYGDINMILRRRWEYHGVGEITEKRVDDACSNIVNLHNAIVKSPAPNESFIAFRGVNIDPFKDYGIENYSDLPNMKGQFMFEPGFSSCSILPEKSFFNRDLGEKSLKPAADIEIRYKIPSGCHDAMILPDDLLSYSPQHTEALIDLESLSYISDVITDKDGHYVLDAILIPRAIYNPDYQIDPAKLKSRFMASDLAKLFLKGAS